MALLETRPDILTVRGNHERQLTSHTRGQMSASDRLAHSSLSPSDLATLGGLPERLEVVAGVLAFHGSPTDDLCYLLETVDPAAPNGLREATDEEVSVRLSDDAGGYAVYLCGHTHLQRIRWLPDGSLVVNPGSLGWPAYSDHEPHPHVVEAASPLARYALLVSNDGVWDVAVRAIEYDVAAAVAMAKDNGRDDVAYALRTGRVSRAGQIPLHPFGA